MIEKVVLDYLSDALDVPVYMETPADHSKKYVIVQKTGSGTDNKLCSATLAIQSYAVTLFEAAELNETVKAAMNDAADHVSEITRSKLNSDYPYTDTAKKQPRYQAVYDITHY